MATEEEYQEKERNKAVPAVYIMIMNPWDAMLLMLRDGTGYQDGRYDTPSGHVEEGELPWEAAIRESREEVGVEIDPKDLHLMHISYRPKHDKTGDRVDFFFVARIWSGTPTIKEPTKCSELKWANSDSIIELARGGKDSKMVPHVWNGIYNFLQGRPFSQLNMKWIKERGMYNL